MLLYLEGCTISVQTDGKYLFMVAHPQLTGISVNCNKLGDAVEAFKTFKVMCNE